MLVEHMHFDARVEAADIASLDNENIHLRVELVAAGTAADIAAAAAAAAAAA